MKFLNVALSLCLWTVPLKAKSENYLGISEPAVTCECMCGYYHLYKGTLFMIKNVHHYKFLSQPDRWWTPFSVVNCTLSASDTLHVHLKRTGKVIISIIHTPQTRLTYSIHSIDRQSVELPAWYDTAEFSPYRVQEL